jgi:hypothetical protein
LPRRSRSPPWSRLSRRRPGDLFGPQRDYHHGPYPGQFAEVKLGLRDIGLVRLNARAIEIDGIRQPRAEAVLVTTAAATVQLAPSRPSAPR